MSRLLRLTLLCHGATPSSRAAAFAADDPLADGEAGRVARILPLLPKAGRLVSAPALCARQTAEILSPEFVVDPELRDISYGRWAGETIASLGVSEPDALAAWRADADAAPHGGESLTRFLARISDWLAVHMREEGHLVAVTHPAVIRAALLSILGAPAAAFWNIDVEHLSVTDLRSDGRRWALRSFGRMLYGNSSKSA